MLISRYSLAIVHRHFLVWKRLMWSSLASNVVNPILFLFAFGFGLGSFIESIDGIDYLAFIVPGIVAYAAMFAASFEATISAYSRYMMQGTWDAILASLVTLAELLFGEMPWAALKALFAGMCVVVVGGFWGGIPSLQGALIAIPLVFVASLGFAAYGLLATSLARGFDFFSYFFTFWLTPMFVFSGVFFDIERFPAAVQVIAWLLPMTHLIAVIRPLMAGMPIDVAIAAMHFAYLLVLTVAAFWCTYCNMRRRLFD